MKMRKTVFLSLTLWLGLPLTLYVYFVFSALSHLTKPAVLFILYTGFSWSIALLAFFMGSTRQQLFSPLRWDRSALRLGFYGGFAVILAILTSPWVAEATRIETALIVSLSFGYSYLAGLLYWFVVMHMTGKNCK